MKTLSLIETNSISGGGFWNWVSAAFTAYDAYERLDKLHKDRNVNDKDDPTLCGFGICYSDLYDRDQDSSSRSSNSSDSFDEEKDLASDRAEEREARNNW